MKRILILIIGLIGVAYGQSSPTSAKTRFVNGLYLGTKLDSYFNAADSNAIYWRADSVVMAKYKGTARALAFAVSGGYLPISDTAAMLSNLLRKTDTAAMLLPFMQYSDTANMLSPYARTSNLPDFSAKVNVSDTASMLSNYRRSSTLIENADLRNSAITINGSSTALGSSISVGTVTSVGLTAPTGFTVSNSPITSSGNIGLSFTAGYSLPTTASQALWDVAYNKRLVSASLNTTQLTLTAGDASTVTTSVPTFNQNTTGTAASLSAVLSSSLGGAGAVNGILKANGSGTVSAAVAGDITSLISGTYVDLTTNQTIGGNKTFTNALAAGGTNPSTLTGDAGSYPRWQFTVDTKTWEHGYRSGTTAYEIREDGTTRFSIANGGAISTTGSLNGTSLSMSGAGSFGGTAISSMALTLKESASLPYAVSMTNRNATQQWAMAVDAGTVDDRILGIFNITTNSTPFAISGTDGTVMVNTTTTDGTNKLIVNGGVKGGIINGTSIRNNGVGTFGFNSAGNGEMQMYATSDGGLVMAGRGSSNDVTITNKSGSDVIQIPTGTLNVNLLGSVNISSSVTASSFVKSGGTSSQYLMADGSTRTGIIQPIRVETSNYTLTANDYTVVFSTSGGNLTATLPAGVEGKVYNISYLTPINQLTIVPNGSETIVNGLSSYVINSGTCIGGVTLQFSNTTWHIIATSYNQSCL